MIERALSFYILRTLARHRRTLMFFAIWVPWGDAGFFALFASGRLSWLLELGSCRGCFCPPGVDFVSPGATFWVLRVALVWAWGPRSASSRKVWKNIKNETTWELNWELFGTHFESAAAQNRADKRFVALFCQSFFESVSCSVPEGLFRWNCWVQEASGVRLRQ